MAALRTPTCPARTDSGSRPSCLQGQLTRCLEILACILGLLILTWSIQRCAANLIEAENLAATANPAADPRLGADMRLYIGTVNQFLVTGELYPRPKNESVASMYVPMVPISRLMPAFHLQLLPFAKSPDPETLIKPARLAMIAVYCLACLALIRHIAMIMYKQEISRRRIALFCIFATIAASSSYGLQDSIILTNYEIPILSLLIAAFLFFSKYPGVSAVILGYAAIAKYYPAFMTILLLTRFNKKTIALFLLSLVFFFSMGWLVFGQKENTFYLSQILPVLLSEKLAPLQYNMSFGGAIFRLTQNIDLTEIAFQIYRFLFLGMGFYLLVKHSTKTRIKETSTFALLMTTMLICLPNYWQTYLILLFPAFCVAIYRMVIQPAAAPISILMIAIASMATDNNAWVAFGYPAWVSGGEPDEFSNMITDTALHQSMSLAMLIFARHYPSTAALYLLEQIKFIVPAVLWAFTAREIMSPAVKHRSADYPVQPTSSKPERCRRA